MDLTSISSVDPTAGTSVLSTQGGSFGDDPFLSLLIAEMRTQTPLDPVDNASFMQQMSSFSSMQQQQELNANMLQLLDYQGVLARLQGLSEGSALLGKDVTYIGEGGELDGRVESIYVTEQGDVRLRIGDDEVDMRSVTSIRQPTDKSGDGTTDEHPDEPTV